MRNIKMTAALLVALPVILTTGCSTGYYIVVDSINSGEQIENKKYIIAAGNENIERNDLQFREYSAILAEALDDKGYKQLDPDNRKKADLIIFLSYGVGDPEKHTYSYSEPVWGQTGSTERTYADIYEEDGETVIYSYTDVDPEYGITGYETKTQEYVTYEKFVVIDAYSTREKNRKGKMKHIWKTTAYTQGRSKKLRKLFPYLIAAASKYLGGNTGHEIDVIVTEDDEKLKKLKPIKSE